MEIEKAVNIAFSQWMDEQDSQWAKPYSTRNWRKTDVLFKRYLFIAEQRNQQINNGWKHGL